jgi:hypothetical protein
MKFVWPTTVTAHPGFDGALVGADEGNSVGDPDGDAEGDPDGEFDGDADGGAGDSVGAVEESTAGDGATEACSWVGACDWVGDRLGCTLGAFDGDPVGTGGSPSRRHTFEMYGIGSGCGFTPPHVLPAS